MGGVLSVGVYLILLCSLFCGCCFDVSSVCVVFRVWVCLFVCPFFVCVLFVDRVFFL